MYVCVCVCVREKDSTLQFVDCVVYQCSRKGLESRLSSMYCSSSSPCSCAHHHPQGLRGKTRTLSSYPESPKDLPVWNFDGSSTGQAKGHDSDVYIAPVAIYG